MSQNDKDSKDLERLEAQVQETVKMDQLNFDTKKKKAVVENHRYTTAIDRMEKDNKDLKLLRNANFGEMSVDQIKGLQKDNLEYLSAATRCMEFIDPVFEGIIPFFQKNVILIAASSGDGKSTVAANITYGIMQSINPLTNKKRKVLILTNEEKAEDFYNRITSLTQKWRYSNHAKFSDEQRATFDRAIPALAKNGWLTVVSDNYGGSSGATTTLEGIETIFENLIENNVNYDCIILDYYQNVISSTEYPDINEYEVQRSLCRLLDGLKNRYPAPIVVLAQCRPENQNSPKPFKERVEGSKNIFNTATCAIELTADKKLLKSAWTIWKSRFNSGVGESFNTGFQKGRFVPYSNEFIEEVDRGNREWAIRTQNQELNKSIGIKDVQFNKGDENGNAKN